MPNGRTERVQRKSFLNIFFLVVFSCATDFDRFELRFPSLQTFFGGMNSDFPFLSASFFWVPVGLLPDFFDFFLFGKFQCGCVCVFFLKFGCRCYILPLPISGVISFLRFIRDHFFSSFSPTRSLHRSSRCSTQTHKSKRKDEENVTFFLCCALRS